MLLLMTLIPWPLIYGTSILREIAMDDKHILFYIMITIIFLQLYPGCSADLWENGGVRHYNENKPIISINHITIGYFPN